LTILKAARFTESPARPTSRYLPGFSALPRTRPENLKEFCPAAPWWVKPPFSALKRVHLFFSRLPGVCFLHLPPTRRPFSARSTVKLTALAAEIE
jgi:hypothetical protein